ncbi:Protein phosphatase 1 regulatory subunit 15B [Merluccius polli]|uniref:Protein phosphatase 1 regulatory subunit 15B n=1 Tax=Merluccius polli TaxID=89951 RepID=A0AA47MR33_MERPO|nr:Protein phosphatase 1 regulatory subunit 15B [Merluccius polli]
MSGGAQVSESRPGGHGGPSSRGEKQETPWISVLSVVSRPALSLLHKYLPGLLQTRPVADGVPEWVSEDLRPTLSGKGVAYLGQLGDMMPLTERNHQEHGGRLNETRGDGNLKWLTAESLSELGIKRAIGDVGEQPITGDISSARNHGHVVLNATSSAEATGPLLKSPTWWGGFWGSEDGSQGWLSKLSLGKGEAVRGAHCSPPPPAGTKAAVAQTTALFVQFSSWESTASENGKRKCWTVQQPVDNGSLESPRPESPKCSDALVLQQEPGTDGANVGEVVLTPDQDNGYSSLEEGHALCQPHAVKVIAEEELRVAGDIAIVEKVTSEPTEGPPPAAKGMVEEGTGEDACDVGGSEEDGGAGETTTQEGSSAAADLLTSPYCQNRAIAFIMGSPCSEDEDDDNDNEDADSLLDSEVSDCDDGFDSECSSEISDSDSDDSNSDNRVDSEAERLWNSLCQTQDPYNLRNFTAPMNTAPRPIPSTSAAAAARSSDSSPDSSPDQGSAPPVSLSLSVSPPGLQHLDSWDDSTSASEAEDGDRLCLWNSFSSSSDPYSLLNFQAPVRTERPLAEVQEEDGCRDKKKSLKMPPRSAHQAAAASSPPQYRRDEAEDRLDSGFSEPPARTAATAVTSLREVFKKVRFCEEVEEFFTSSREDEDRRGQWEELARDRYRFSRRCRDVEQSIAYCLEPLHRTLMFQRITADYHLES